MDDDYARAWDALGLPTPDASISSERGEDEARYVAFLEWFESKAGVSAESSSVQELVSFEPDEDVRKSMYRLIIRQSSLVDLSNLVNVEEVRSWVEEEMTIRRLDEELDEVELLQLLNGASRRVQLKMASRKALPSSVLEHLANEGMTKAIRHQAASQLRARN